MLRETVTIERKIHHQEDNKEEWLEKQKKEDRRLEYNDIHHLNELIKEILAYNKKDYLSNSTYPSISQKKVLNLLLSKRKFSRN